MAYFDKFPLYLTRTVDGTNIIITDFFRRVDVSQIFGDVSVALLPYLIQNGDTPESVANAFYGSPFYHWIILLINNIVNVRSEWPLDSLALEQKILKEYASPYDVHHYFNTVNGYWVDYSTDPNVIPILNIEYEQAVNDAKRTIKILDPQYLSTFVTTFDSLIGA